MFNQKIFKIIFLAAVFAATILAFFYFKGRGNLINNNTLRIKSNDLSRSEERMLISTFAFEDGGIIPIKYTCDGDGVNPPLKFYSAPKEAKSLLLLVDDPDASGGTFTHWIVFNIDPTTTSIAEGKAPAGATEGRSTSGDIGYLGPCPPSGTHRYFFRLYALDTTLGLKRGANREEIMQMASSHIIAQAEYMGQYGRQ